MLPCVFTVATKQHHTPLLNPHTHSLLSVAQHTHEYCGTLAWKVVGVHMLGGAIWIRSAIVQIEVILWFVGKRWRDQSAPVYPSNDDSVHTPAPTTVLSNNGTTHPDAGADDGGEHKGQAQRHGPGQDQGCLPCQQRRRLDQTWFGSAAHTARHGCHPRALPVSARKLSTRAPTTQVASPRHGSVRCCERLGDLYV